MSFKWDFQQDSPRESRLLRLQPEDQTCVKSVLKISDRKDSKATNVPGLLLLHQWQVRNFKKEKDILRSRQDLARPGSARLIIFFLQYTQGLSSLFKASVKRTSVPLSAL